MPNTTGGEEENVGGPTTLLDAVRRHFRPELVNRLTGIVPFTPIGMETARESVEKSASGTHASPGVE